MTCEEPAFAVFIEEESEIKRFLELLLLFMKYRNFSYSGYREILAIEVFPRIEIQLYQRAKNFLLDASQDKM